MSRPHTQSRRARKIRAANGGWANWYIDRGRLSLWSTKRDLRNDLVAQAMNPTVERLRERLLYDPATGTLRWREHPSMPARWNTRYGGREAFAGRNHQGYRVGKVDGVRLLASRVIWALVHGAWPEDKIDHEDRDRANNRLANLRPATDVSNARNRTMNSNNTSGVTGVCWHKARDRWAATIGGVRLGYFVSLEEAVRVRKAAEVERGYHPTHGAPAFSCN